MRFLKQLSLLFVPSFFNKRLVIEPIMVVHAAADEKKNVESSSDRLQGWTERWENNKIAWHQDFVHEALLLHGDKLIPNLLHDDCVSADTKSEDPTCAAAAIANNNKTRVFVPLCGKSLDMAYLARKTHAVAQVVGIDGVRTALTDFANEHPDLNIQPKAETECAADSADADTVQQFETFIGNNIVLLKGDFFHLTETVTGGRFGAIFDRASLHAIDPTMREAYVDMIRQLIAPGGNILLVVAVRNFGTDQDKAGPPFSVPEVEVRRLYETKPWVESVTMIEAEGDKQRYVGKPMISQFYLIQAKS